MDHSLKWSGLTRYRTCWQEQKNYAKYALGCINTLPQLLFALNSSTWLRHALYRAWEASGTIALYDPALLSNSLKYSITLQGFSHSGMQCSNYPAGACTCYARDHYEMTCSLYTYCMTDATRPCYVEACSYYCTLDSIHMCDPSWLQTKQWTWAYFA